MLGSLERSLKRSLGTSIGTNKPPYMFLKGLGSSKKGENILLISLKLLEGAMIS